MFRGILLFQIPLMGKNVIKFAFSAELCTSSFIFLWNDQNDILIIFRKTELIPGESN